MASTTLLLKCKSKKGVFTLDSLTHESTISDLKIQLLNFVNVEPHELIVLSGYPPKRIDMSNDKKKLSEIPLKSHETLIIEGESDSDDTVDYHQSVPVCAVKPLPQASEIIEEAQEALMLQPIDEPQVLGVLPQGVLLRYIMPANNSCLFSSICFAASQDKRNLSNTSYLREIIAETVAADPETYSDAFLGQPNREYCEWIRNEEHWGGAIEISILSKHFALEIVAVDLQNVRLHFFGENYNFDNRIFLIYNGVHYDALAMRLHDESSSLQTIFPVTNEIMLQKVKDLALAAKLVQPLKDLQGRRISCMHCNRSFQSQEEMSKHALETKHIQYQQE